MPLTGSCDCRAVRFTCASHTPYPYMRCYCNACRKTAGGGGFAINIMARADSLEVTGRARMSAYGIVAERGAEGPARRSFCTDCGSYLWNFDPTWPDLLHPFASAIDTPLPVPPERSHIMLAYRAAWCAPEIREGDSAFSLYPDQSIEDWHRTRNLWLD
ncbi:MAG: GFA family protein [Rhodobacteraceae bacterium]|nr:GFA family protein [Paracoccaceae bacterium]